MKKLLTLVLCWLIAFSAMAETTFKAKTALSAAGGYVTSQNKVDGSFEDGISSWVASVGTIVKTASTEIQGNYAGVWSGTGTGTLDLRWTATASNTFDANAFVNVGGEDDVYICAYVGTTETGCKLIPALDKIQKVSVIADSIIGSAFYLRLKHTGSDAFSVKVDDGKIEPQAFQNVQVVEQESVTYTGYTSKNASNFVLFAKKDTNRSNEKNIISVNQSVISSYIRYDILKNSQVTVNFNADYSSATGNPLQIYHYDSSGTVKKYSDSANGTGVGANGTTLTTYAISGDYFIAHASSAVPSNSLYTNFNITATAITDNVIQSYQDGTEWTSYTPTIQGFGTASSVNFKWKKSGGDIRIIGNFTSGTLTAAEPRISLPNSLTILTGSPIKTDAMVGAYYSATRFGLYTLGVAGNSYVNIGVQKSTAAGQTIITDASVALDSNNIYYVDITVPIQGWSSAPPLLALPVSKENRFEIEINADGTISKQNNTGITVTKGTTGIYTINYSSLGLTAVPIVKAEEKGINNIVGGSNPRFRDLYSTTSTSTVVRTGYNSGSTGTVLDLPFVLTIVKQSPDYTAPGVFVGNVAKNQVAIIKDIKPNGVDGGTSVAGTWTKRTLNTLEGDVGIVSLNLDQFTLQAGDYEIYSDSPFYKSNVVRTRLRNITDGTTTSVSGGIYLNSGAFVEGRSSLMTRFSISTAKTFEIQYYASAALTTTGLGVSTSDDGEVEVYTQVKITKLNGQ